MKESDWKKFTLIKKQALEDLCERILDQSNDIISDDSKGFHQRYVNLYTHIMSSDDDIAAGFNGHSRSGAFLQLMLFRKLNLVSDEALSVLSEEFQRGSDPDFGM